VESKFHNTYKNVDMLPGESKWRHELLKEACYSEADKASENGDNLSDDSGVERRGFYSDEFDDQSFIGSPGCNTSDDARETFFDTTSPYRSPTESESESEYSGMYNDNPETYNQDSQDSDDQDTQNSNDNKDTQDTQDTQGSRGEKRKVFESESISDDNDDKRQRTMNDQQSPIDYVLEKQACDMPDIQDSDGGGD
jgi:hypothetical protein